MSTRFLVVAAAVATAAVGLWPGMARATKLFSTVSGTVTAVPIGSTITVNGRTYPIAHNSRAATQVQTVVSGEKVRVSVEGAADSRTAKVVAIHVFSAH